MSTKKYTIRPMTWRKSGAYWHSDTLFGGFSIAALGTKSFLLVTGRAKTSKHASLQAAKKAAESSYRRRLETALEEVKP